MNNDLEKLKQLEEDYNQIQIPNELNTAVKQAIMCGKLERKKRQHKNKMILNMCSSIVIALVLLTSIVNISPTFAESFKSIPIVGQLVDILQFVDGNAVGGTIVDGTDVDELTLVDEESSDSIIIHFAKDGEDQDIAGAYEISYHEKPFTLTFSISGARMLSAEKDFDSIRESKYVKDVYKHITLDDSMVRFTVVFNGPVSFEIIEMKEPACLVVNLKEGLAVKEKSTFTVRTRSYSVGESLAVIEEELMKLNEVRVLKDREGTYFVEVGQYETEEEAKNKIDSLASSLNEELFIEVRGLYDEPEVIDF